MSALNFKNPMRHFISLCYHLMYKWGKNSQYKWLIWIAKHKRAILFQPCAGTTKQTDDAFMLVTSGVFVCAASTSITSPISTHGVKKGRAHKRTHTHTLHLCMLATTSHMTVACVELPTRQWYTTDNLPGHNGVVHNHQHPCLRVPWACMGCGRIWRFPADAPVPWSRST